MKRDDLVAYLDDYLQVEAIEDTSNNGLQVEGASEISRLAMAVDASLAAIEGACEADAQMLIVHHGLFWGKPLMVSGVHGRRLKALLDSDTSLYAVHLPLDYHEEVGNNAVLARWLKLKDVSTFGQYKGHPAGFAGVLTKSLSLDAFKILVEKELGKPITGEWPFGPDRIRRVGIVSGGAAFLVDQAAEAGLDVYLTGEVSHSFYHQARELGLNVIFGGHYATETVGLQALAGHLADQFGFETEFLDLPTGA
jgi:dinuclear metal center YbgI/SA1388 family protein